jgi:hypothetical protein
MRIDPFMALKPKSDIAVRPVPASMSIRGLARGSKSGPIQSVSIAATGKPRVIWLSCQ